MTDKDTIIISRRGVLIQKLKKQEQKKRQKKIQDSIQDAKFNTLNIEKLIRRAFFRVFLGELLRVLEELLLVLGVLLGQVCPEGVVGLRLVHQLGQALDHLVGASGRFPVLCADDGQADLSFLVDIGVVYLGLEGHLWGLKGIFWGEYHLYTECAFVVWSRIRYYETLP